MNPVTDFYKQLSVRRLHLCNSSLTMQIEASRQQIGIDMFLFGCEYMDVATLSHASKYSAGSLYYFPNYSMQTSKGAMLSHSII